MAAIDLGPCKYCKHVLGGIVIRHTIMDCQYRRSMYCPVCMSYGHTPGDCPNKIAWAIRRGEDASDIQNDVLFVKSHEEGIKEVLRTHGLEPGTTILENRKRLRNLANSLMPTKLIIFVEPK